MKKFYLKDKKGNRVGTVVSVRHDDHVHYGVSTLNVKFDKFDPKEGTGRAALDLLTHFKEGDQAVDIVQGRVREFILEHIAQNTSLPQRARNAAQGMVAASPYIQINHAIDEIEEIIHHLAPGALLPGVMLKNEKAGNDLF